MAMSEDGTGRSECPECGNGPEGVLFDPRPNPESNHHTCTECDHEWTDESGPEDRADGSSEPADGADRGESTSERTVEVRMAAKFHASADVPVSVLQDPDTDPQDYEEFVESYQPAEPWSITAEMDWRCGHCGRRPRLKHSERPEYECARCGSDVWQVAPDDDGDTTRTEVDEA